MKDGARLVNAARGALIDEEALAEALASGKLAGAALDVFSAEPYDGPLLELDNVVVTPHLAASTDEAQDRAGVIIAEQVVAALEGGLVTNAVNIPVVDKAALDVLGPFIPLAAQARAARRRARRRQAAPGRRRGARADLRLRHAPAHGRRARRHLPGPGRPDRQLRQRVAARGRARDHRLRGAAARLARLHERGRGARDGRKAGTRSRSRGRRSGRSRACSSRARTASGSTSSSRPTWCSSATTTFPA